MSDSECPYGTEGCHCTNEAHQGIYAEIQAERPAQARLRVQRLERELAAARRDLAALQVRVSPRALAIRAHLEAVLGWSLERDDSSDIQDALNATRDESEEP